jgi:hypothetical protein
MRFAELARETTRTRLPPEALAMSLGNSRFVSRKGAR